MHLKYEKTEPSVFPLSGVVLAIRPYGFKSFISSSFSRTLPTFFLFLLRLFRFLLPGRTTASPSPSPSPFLSVSSLFSFFFRLLCLSLTDFFFSFRLSLSFLLLLLVFAFPLAQLLFSHLIFLFSCVYFVYFF
ncbi:hypothetical protein I3842_05G003000 [Carya illinoinensis]|uniref:Transmembrane protein n=1 Tax=Carya illinoinensis TaxID=32201 RepID=A0A922EYA2_CARIL|nr:hypothetical protein I3842_05G003000 [Carya illinoinensis]